MTPSWYDVLDVAPDASTEEVRAAWRSGVADLDPTDRRFRLLNQAAEVLLDPARRAEHDAALAADADAEVEDEVDEPAGGRRRDLPDDVVDPSPVPQEPRGRWSRRRSAADGAEPVGRAASNDERRRDHPTTTSYAGWAPPVWLLIGLALAVAVLVGAAAWVSRAPTDGAIEADTRSAQSAAEEASGAVLSYDYRDLDANRQAASAYLTPAFRDDYDKLFTVIEQNAEQVQPVVTVEVVSSGIERVSADGDRVSVLVFVNRPTTNASSSTPQVYQDFVTMQMQLVDGDWLVDDMVATPAAP